ncbi:transglutaminase-like domain-containing protein [Lacrimispora sp. JR3]|uniref:transglutaminase-like domain-containing protein n=1 Tax=Lacrimispora sinapis TaxID=3111456 RepID=UPI00374A47D5
MKKRGAAFAAVCGGILLAINGCGPKGSITAADNTKESIEWKTVVSIKDEGVPLSSKPEGKSVKKPQASGTVTFRSNSVTLDASNASHGYVMVQYTGNASRIKVQVIKNGGETYTYDLNARSAYEVFPLTEGNGTYTVRVLEQVQGTQYAIKSSNQIPVKLVNEFEPFLYPNQYVNFTSESAVVKKGAELAAPAADSLAVVNNVYNYVVNNFTYDTALANSVQTGYLPNVDQVLAKKKGICFDYAAVMTAMLRSQGIPTKLVVGYTGSLYHAWVNVYIEGQGWVDNIIYFDGNDWKLMDPTFASSGANDPAIRDYITNSSNYKGKYTY